MRKIIFLLMAGMILFSTFASYKPGPGSTGIVEPAHVGVINFKTHHMKNMPQKNPKQNIQFNKNKHRPENKDDLDSREGEEQLIKGTDVTHNKKEKQSERKNTGKNRKTS